MTFNVDVPNDLYSIAGNGPGFRVNFNQANTHFGTDHTPFTGATNIGFHKKVSFIGVNPAAAVPVTPEGITLIAEMKGAGKNKFILHYKQNSAAGGGSDASYQFSNSSVPLLAANGYSYLPGEVFIQWGKQLVPGTPATQTAVNFLIAFDDVPYNIQLSCLRPVSTGTSPMFVYSTVPPSAHGFSIVTTSNTDHDVYWLAIGPKS